MPRIVWPALALLTLAGAPALADDASSPPRIYRWIDENGIAHYATDLERVPEELREQPLRREDASPQAPATIDSWVRRERIPELRPDASSGAGGGDRLAALDARIAELEQAIAADEELLKGDLTNATAPASNETLGEVSERMPARLAELKQLQAERDALAQPSSE
jgi:hypothetical protein